MGSAGRGGCSAANTEAAAGRSIILRSRWAPHRKRSTACKRHTPDGAAVNMGARTANSHGPRRATKSRRWTTSGARQDLRLLRLGERVQLVHVAEAVVVAALRGELVE